MTFEKNDNPLTPFILLLVVEGLGLRNCDSYLYEIFMGGIKRYKQIICGSHIPYDKLACVDTKLSWFVGEH